MKQIEAQHSRREREEDQGLTRKQAAELCGLRPEHLANMAVFGQGPPFRKLKPGKRGKVVYLKSEVLAWLRSLPAHGGRQQAEDLPRNGQPVRKAVRRA